MFETYKAIFFNISRSPSQKERTLQFRRISEFGSELCGFLVVGFVVDREDDLSLFLCPGSWEDLASVKCTAIELLLLLFSLLLSQCFLLSALFFAFAMLLSTTFYQSPCSLIEAFAPLSLALWYRSTDFSLGRTRSHASR